MRYLDDLALGAWFPCGSFRLSPADIIAFARLYDPQPFHLDPEAAARSHFGRLCASGLHTQGMAIGLLVPRIADVAVVAGYSLNQARFRAPTWPDTTYDVRACWTAISPSPANPGRGRADIGIEVSEGGATVASLGVTYVVARKEAAPS